tara:strand:- start:4 stop:540 length:537 start_codon:yes stop_codon:yes gene_type:complete
MKICKCGAEFVQYTTLMNKCAKCLADNAKKKREEDNKIFSRDDVRKARKQLKKLSDSDRSVMTRRAQTAFNAYIRKRDEKEACISCGRHHQGQYHAGHYRSVGSSPENRYNELNVHKQCSACNNHLSGNLIPYRVNLIDKIGLDAVELIENSSKAKKYTVEELKEIEQEYKRKLKELN